ncbi:MAG: hypothetical protein IJK23_00375 [Clostridia bacterium]|nr:hypothetical protein [Clostridia bacterium]
MNQFRRRVIVFCVIVAMAAAAVPVCVFAGADADDAAEYTTEVEEYTYCKPDDVEWEIICRLPTAPYDRGTGYVPSGIGAVTKDEPGVSVPEKITVPQQGPAVTVPEEITLPKEEPAVTVPEEITVPKNEPAVTVPEGTTVPKEEPAVTAPEGITRPEAGVTSADDKQNGEAGTTQSQAFKEYRLGDVDMNGKIQSADARLALRAAARLVKLTDLQKTLADITKDGVVTSRDARLILRFGAKLDPAPEEYVRVPAE